MLTPGRKAYCDASRLLFETQALSVRLDMILVNNFRATSIRAMGRVSSSERGESTFGMATMRIFFQFRGTLPVRIHRFRMRSRAVMTASSQFFRTPMRRPERPAAVVSEGWSIRCMSSGRVITSDISVWISNALGNALASHLAVGWLAGS